MIFQIVSNFNKVLRKFLLGSYRQEKISSQITRAIIDLKYQKEIKILDYGSGYFKPSMANLISKNLKERNITSHFVCLDFYEDDELKKMNSKKNIKYMNLNKFKYINDIFDYCIIADTLHHIGEGVENLDNLSSLLKMIKKKATLFAFFLF